MAGSMFRYRGEQLQHLVKVPRHVLQAIIEWDGVPDRPQWLGEGRILVQPRAGLPYGRRGGEMMAGMVAAEARRALRGVEPMRVSPYRVKGEPAGAPYWVGVVAYGVDTAHVRTVERAAREERDGTRRRAEDEEAVDTWHGLVGRLAEDLAMALPGGADMQRSAVVCGLLCHLIGGALKVGLCFGGTVLVSYPQGDGGDASWVVRPLEGDAWAVKRFSEEEAVVCATGLDAVRRVVRQACPGACGKAVPS